MKRSKRLLAMLLVTAMLCPALGIGAAAADTTEEATTTPTLTVECPEKASPGQEITVTVKVENNDDLAAAKLVVDYDKDVLELEKTEAATALAESSGDTTIWVSADEDGLYQKQKATFTMVTYTFKVLGSAGDTATVTISEDDSEFTSYEKEADVLFSINEDTLTVEQAYAKGDVNGDGKVSLLDYGIILKHVRKITYITDPGQLSRADVNGDGKITLLDYGAVLKIVRKIQ
jgi:oligoribonuclease NrnB/cAMP/cGMP phosphodiesterase (DHH superfamily)